MSLVEVTHEGAVAYIQLNDPARKNAMGKQLAEEFAGATALLAQNSGRRCIVISGAGQNFSAGGDIDMLRWLCTLRAHETEPYMLKFYESFLGIRRLNIPLVAAIEGVAVGAGLCLALACDVVVAHPATRVSLNFAKLGLHAGMGATYLAPHKLGGGMGQRVLIGAEMLTAADVAAAGGWLLSDTPLARAKLFAEHIASNAPGATQAMLTTRRDAESTALREALSREAKKQAQSYLSDELRLALERFATRKG